MSSSKSEIPPKAGSNANAERLKAQGNALHVQGQYKAAYKKYSEAIKEDPTNAVLWANRAASGLGMKEYLDAARDAEQATQLDPKYAKAWGRLATAGMALSVTENCIKAWKTALSCLPAEGVMTAEHKALKAQFEAGLKKAEVSIVEQENVAKDNLQVFSVDEVQKDLPWMRALAMEKDLIQQQKASSAFVIMNAYRDFSEGINTMKNLKVTRTSDDKDVINGGQAIVNISNGILRDKRVFHVDIPDWDEKYNRQVQLECGTTGAWHYGGAKLVQEEAPRRLKSSGWTAVRRALSTTVRFWVMRGFYQGSMGDHVAGIEFLRRSLDVLEWGSREWKDVPRSECGVIFELSFIRGVRRLYLSELMNGFSAKGEEIGHNIEDIAEIARQMIVETDANPPSGAVDVGFLASFWLYAKADAISILGWYHMQLGLVAEEEAEKQELFGQAAKYYTEAADTYFKDDEHHVYFLKIALEAHWWRGDPLRITLPLCARIRAAIPDMKKIWELYLQKMESEYQMVLEFEAASLKEVDAGNLTLNEVGRPEYMQDTINARSSVRQHLKTLAD